MYLKSLVLFPLKLFSPFVRRNTQSLLCQARVWHLHLSFPHLYADLRHAIGRFYSASLHFLPWGYVHIKHTEYAIYQVSQAKRSVYCSVLHKGWKTRMLFLVDSSCGWYPSHANWNCYCWKASSSGSLLSMHSHSHVGAPPVKWYETWWAGQWFVSDECSYKVSYTVQQCAVILG